MIVDAAVYENGRRLDEPFDLARAAELSRRDNTFCWIGLFEPDESEFDDVRKYFDLHELAVEDAVEAHQRPKLERYGDTLLVVLKPAEYIDSEEVIHLGEILMFVADDFVVIVRHGRVSSLSRTRAALEADPGELAAGPGAVLLAVMDQVVDDYVDVLAGLDQDVQEVEYQVFTEKDVNPAERIYRLMRGVIAFHQATQPLVDPLDRLTRGRFEAVHPDLREYFRDVSDNLDRVVDRTDAYRDLLASILEANLTQVSIRQNEDMRKIAAWVAIAAVPTMLAGIWGMNFDIMPELNETWGYPAALALMAMVALVLYRLFKRSGWL